MLRKKAPAKKAPAKKKAAKVEDKPAIVEEAPAKVEHPGLAILEGAREANQSDTTVYILTAAQIGALKATLS